MSEDVRSYNVGKSNYAKHKIQPWDIWLEYDLNPWDADIVKRILRTKEEPGMSAKEARKLDYDKIIHICNERKRQLDLQKDTVFNTDSTLTGRITTSSKSDIGTTFTMTKTESVKYGEFCLKHKDCNRTHPTTIGGGIGVTFMPTGVGTSKTAICEICGEKEDITNYDNW